ncbi:MAG TPA: type VI secretion system baseplate subunit TssF [Burkholderiaceae bacterium]|nr:type VI secretion system baseplate subunit TssF [Burkholderiaceae bacterium]HMX10130.1 type VI secretion system baseplate subunit TssF [Burkholderiaceae bacterium]HNB43523.1 type VI secretion system baseplate subunit TssF [Burkholderiaceae bacterium]HNG78658.1 type VI secretion system baseplate subunit TssF [Burkholderiaceae bacterium]
MDPGLLRLYNQELAHLREMGAEFAREFPKIAARLTMDGLEVADPYVERLLEGFAFMAARTQLKLDAEYPRFIHSLLAAIYPDFLSPVPSMMVLRFLPAYADPALAQGFTVPRQTTVRSALARGQGTRCEFRTGQAVTLWPVELVGLQYFSHVPDLPLSQLAVARQVRGGLRLRLKVHGGLQARELAMDRLSLYLSAPDDTALRLFELLTTATLGTWLPVDAALARAQWAQADSLKQQGFDNDQALLPQTPRGFSGHRLLQEFAAMPQRLMAFEIGQLRERLRRVPGDEFELVVLLSKGDPALESLVDANSLSLYCTPAINLFPKRLDRIPLQGPGSAAAEHHVVPDRTRPMDFEVYALQSVKGHGTGEVAEQDFLPLYTSHHTEPAGHAAYYTLRREPRLLSQRQKEQGTRSSYVGSEVFISLVDPQHAPYDADLRQLSAEALVSNRDLPMLLPGAGQREAGGPATSTWVLDATAPLQSLQCLRGPTPVVQRLARGELGWALINQLTLNHLSIAGEDPHKAAAALRGLLMLHGHPADAGWRKLVEGIRSVQARSVTRRLPGAGRMAFGTGVQIDVEVDELGLPGSSVTLLGSVLERFFARHAALNSFTETRLFSASRGQIMAWPALVGQTPIL